MAQEQAGRFVVVHTAVNDWRQGEVISRDQLVLRKSDDPDKVLGDMHDRLLAAGAIRPAAEHEAGQGRVEVLPYGVAVSPEAAAILATKDAEIDQLTRALAAARDRAAAQRAMGAPGPDVVPEEDPTLQPVLAEKDARIKQLRGQLEATLKGIAGGQESLNRQGDERARAAQEARGGREWPAQSVGQLLPGAEQPQQPQAQPTRVEGQGQQPAEGQRAAEQQEARAQQEQQAREHQAAAERQRAEEQARQQAHRRPRRGEE